jgi:PTH1 family peptidyl-tRNA hydrolase
MNENWMIVGIGNPGKKYETTRHNVGFHTIDVLAKKLGVPLRSRRFKTVHGTGSYAGNKVILVKPQTYVNLSGEAVRSLSRYYGVSPEHILVVCDDVYLELGAIRIRPSGSAGGHNGLKNIISQLGSEGFPRVRLGTGPQPEGMDLIEFVLRPMTSGERKCMKEVYEEAAEACLVLMKDGAERAMNLYNGKKSARQK